MMGYSYSAANNSILPEIKQVQLVLSASTEWETLSDIHLQPPPPSPSPPVDTLSHLSTTLPNNNNHNNPKNPINQSPSSNHSSNSSSYWRRVFKSITRANQNEASLQLSLAIYNGKQRNLAVKFLNTQSNCDAKRKNNSEMLQVARAASACTERKMRDMVNTSKSHAGKQKLALKSRRRTVLPISLI